MVGRATMITVLQRQTVSKRALPPVAARARSNGVRWSNRDFSRAPREHTHQGERSFLLPRTVNVQKKQPPRVREERSFLRRQFVHVQRKRAKRAGEKRWARIIQNAAAHRGSIRQQRRSNGDSPRERGAVRAALRRTIRSPWLFVAIAAAAALAFAFSSLTVTGLPLVQERPVLPVPAEADPALYGLLVPDQGPRQSAGGA